MPVALGRFAKQPWLPSVWNFLRSLGQTGARIQAAEVALRYFENAGPKDTEAFGHFVTTEAAKCGLAIGLSDFQEARSSAAKWYTVETCQIWTSFTKNLVAEYRLYKRLESWKSKSGPSTLTSYQQLLLNLPKAPAKALKETPEFRIIEYYLAVRNWIVHPNQETLHEADDAFEALRNGCASHIRERYRAVKAPNAASALQFDDYMLLSRACVGYAAVINDACDLQNEDIEARLYSTTKSLLRNHTMPIGRIRNIARAYFTRHHGSNRARRDEFGEYVVEAFKAGKYFK
jgi:hypothetical protein